MISRIVRHRHGLLYVGSKIVSLKRRDKKRRLTGSVKKKRKEKTVVPANKSQNFQKKTRKLHQNVKKTV